jgi:hypothetical protein
VGNERDGGHHRGWWEISGWAKSVVGGKESPMRCPIGISEGRRKSSGGGRQGGKVGGDLGYA